MSTVNRHCQGSVIPVTGKRVKVSHNQQCKDYINRYRSKETVINKLYRLTRVCRIYFKLQSLFQCATLSQVLEFASTDCIYLPLFTCSCEKWYILITMHL